MSSYVVQNQSRGVGAVASEDLGAVSRASGRAVMAKSPTKSLISRRRRGMRPSRFVQGRSGNLLKSPFKSLNAKVVMPALRKSVVVDVSKMGLKRTLMPIVERPTGVVPAGLIAGTPSADAIRVPLATARHSAIHTPAGPTLSKAVSTRNKAIDNAIAMEISEASFQVPQFSAGSAPDEKAKKNKLLLIYGGIGVAGLAAIYLLTRKK